LPSFEIENEKKVDLKLSLEESSVFSYIKKGVDINIDSLFEKTDLNSEQFLDILLRLELKGAISRVPGNCVVREI